MATVTDDQIQIPETPEELAEAIADKEWRAKAFADDETTKEVFDAYKSFVNRGEEISKQVAEHTEATMMKFLKDNGHDAPKSTPAAGSKYRMLEAAFVGFAKRVGMSPRDLDFMVWAVYRNGGHIHFD